MVRSFHDLTYPQLARVFAHDGLHESHARTLWRALHRDLTTSFNDTTLPTGFLPPLVRWMRAQTDYRTDAPAVAKEIPSQDGLTRKYLLRLADGQEVETVLMAYPGRHTACLSTQAGCAMGCVFCATGQMGFARHLRNRVTRMNNAPNANNHTSGSAPVR